MRDYIAAYKEGLSPGPELDKAMKKYKSHRKNERTEFYAYTAYTYTTCFSCSVGHILLFKP